MTVPDREQGTIEQSLHRNAVYQMAQATDMPVKFIDSLQSVAEPWGRQLLAHNLQTVFKILVEGRADRLHALPLHAGISASSAVRCVQIRPPPAVHRPDTPG